MPEGPEVARTADVLNEFLKGRKIVNIAIGPNAKHERLDTIPVGTTIVNVDSYGKRIIFNMEKPDGTPFRMCSFLGMEGHWDQDPKLNHTHIQIYFGRVIPNVNVSKARRKINLGIVEGPPICYSDSRHFGRNVVCYTDDQYKDFFKAIGTDLIKDRDKITPEVWRNKLRNPRIKTKQIATFLLEPKWFSGIGNYLKSEILYRARIYPGRQLQDLTDEEIETLRIVSLDTIMESYKSGGLTIRTYSAPDGSIGKFEKVVYKQDKCPLGYPIIWEKFKDDRMTYWVEELQK